MSSRTFLLWPDGRIEEVDAEGETYDFPNEPGLFDDLVRAGYPLHGDTVGSGTWDGILDLRAEDGRVIVYTSGHGAGEHDMGAASELFLSWLRRADQDEPDTGSNPSGVDRG